MMLIVYILIGIVISISFIVKYKHLFITSAYPSDTIRRVMHAILSQSNTISSISSPTAALIQSRECQSSLNTLITLTGGSKTLSTITGVDAETLQNILYYQEKRITTYINTNET